MSCKSLLRTAVAFVAFTLLAGNPARVLAQVQGRPEAPPFDAARLTMEPPPPEGVAIRAGRLFDPKTGTNLTNQVIVIKGDMLGLKSWAHIIGQIGTQIGDGVEFRRDVVAAPGVEREAVVAAMILVVRGFQADRDLGVGGCALRKTAQFRPFVEVLSFTSRNEDALWDRRRHS